MEKKFILRCSFWCFLYWWVGTKNPGTCQDTRVPTWIYYPRVTRHPLQSLLLCEPGLMTQIRKSHVDSRSQPIFGRLLSQHDDNTSVSALDGVSGRPCRVMRFPAIRPGRTIQQGSEPKLSMRVLCLPLCGLVKLLGFRTYERTYSNAENGILPMYKSQPYSGSVPTADNGDARHKTVDSVSVSSHLSPGQILFLS